MHCTVSGNGDLLAANEEEAIRWGKQYLSYFPNHYTQKPPASLPKDPAFVQWENIIPANQNMPFDMQRVILGLVDEGSWFPIKPLFAPEILVGFARLDGEAVAIVANQSKVKGGVLFVDSADKAARFINLADAFNIPLLFLADVPGFVRI